MSMIITKVKMKKGKERALYPRKKKKINVNNMQLMIEIS
jgi:hypothetical protein